jgi:hypothetical protein
MAQTAQAYGLIPVYSDGGQTRAKKYNILNNAGTGYGTAIYKGDLVKMHTDGTINIGDGTTPALGVFAGCEYIGADGKPVSSPYWPASTALQSGSQAIAYVIDDQNTMFRIGVGGNASDYVGDAAGSRVRAAGSAMVNEDTKWDVSRNVIAYGLMYLDSPATTSPVTYAIQMRRGAGGTTFINRSGLDSDSAHWGRLASSITAIEVKP